MIASEFMKNFTNDYIGRNVGDWDGSGSIECVDGAKFGMFKLGIQNPPTTGTGYASGYWYNYSTNGMAQYFNQIPNASDVQVGDLLIFSSPSPTGHVGWAWKNSQVFGMNQDGTHGGFTFRPVSNWTFLGALRFKGFDGTSQPFHGIDGADMSYEYRETDAQNFKTNILNSVETDGLIRRNGSSHIYKMYIKR